jgi:predicted Zn-dependent protease
MKATVWRLALGLLLAAAIMAPAVRAADTAEQILLDKANYWRLKDRPDLAMEALTKLLFLNPNQPEALYQFGMIEVQQGKLPEARTYLSRLQKAAPGSPRITDLENAIRAGRIGPNELSEARRLAQAGQLAEAVEKYQRSFNGPPPPAFGVEYYLTLAGTPGGWEQAKEGLKQLSNASPNDKSLRLAYAQVLINRETTRPDGIAILMQLSREPAVSADAIKAWRQALIWGLPLQYYGPYLDQFPQDQEIRQRAADLAAQAAGATGRESQAYADLSHGKVALAERQFLADLKKNPGDAQALGGLGLVRLRQERFAEARDLLARAMKEAPEQRKALEAAYDSAAFWASVQQAKALQARGDLQGARRMLVQLLSRPRSDAWGAEMVLATIEARLRDYAAAERSFRRVLAARPRNVDALVGLANVLMAEGKTAEAQSIAGRLSPAARAKIGPGGEGAGSRGELLRKEAKNAEANGNTALAEQKFKEALAADPKNPWLRLDYARFLAGQGRLNAGFAVVDPAQSGNTPTAILAASMFDTQQDRWAEALDRIDRIPAGARTTDINNFRDRILSRATEERAKKLIAAGNREEARRIFAALYTDPHVLPDERRVAVYDLYQLGERRTALQLSREAWERGGPAATKAGVDYAKLLVTDGRYDEAAVVARQIEARGPVSADDRDDLLSIKGLLVARRADTLVTSRDLANAYDLVAPLLAQRPNDPILLMAMGRIYAAGGLDAEALDAFDKADQQDPTNIDIVRGVVMGALQAHDIGRAEDYLAKGEGANPKNPWIFYLKAQIAHARGDNGTALANLRAAQMLAREQGTTAPSDNQPVSAPTVTVPPNPFRRSEATAWPDPALALAPGGESGARRAGS